MLGKILEWSKKLQQTSNALNLWSEIGYDKFHEDMKMTDEMIQALTDEEAQIMLNRLQEAMFIGQIMSLFNKIEIALTFVASFLAIPLIISFYNWGFPLLSHLMALPLGIFLYKRWDSIKDNFEELNDSANFYRRISVHERFKKHF